MVCSTHLPEVLLRFQKLLLAGFRVGQQLVPALHECGVASLDGLGLHVFGGQQLVFEGGDVGDALLLEGLQTSIKGLLQGGTHQRGVEVADGERNGSGGFLEALHIIT